MARKGKNKRKQKKFSKRQFIEIVCSGCSVCQDIENPFFCYNTIYKSNPKKFVDVLKNLINIRNHLELSNQLVGDLEVEEFAETFCDTGICNNIFNVFCPTLPECHTMFKAQANSEGKTQSLKHKVAKFKQKVNARKRRRYICHAYPTFFSSNNEKFKADIERILHGDNIIKQDSNKESAGKVKELSRRNIKGEKS